MLIEVQTRRGTVLALEQRRAFHTVDGTIFAGPIHHDEDLPAAGLLPVEYVDALQAAIERRRIEGSAATPDAPSYLVFGAGTLIAWVTINGRPVVPNVDYRDHDEMLARYQSLVREAFHLAEPRPT